ncbi:MAG: hypothetical protein II720_01180 [Bacteroidales bacterium]|nr:hypothetical protein [Bacteroidales bacterium]
MFKKKKNEEEKIEITFEEIKKESARWIRNLCLERRMCADFDFDCEALDRFITEEMQRSMDKYDNMPPGILFAELANELAKINEKEKRMRTEEDT